MASRSFTVGLGPASLSLSLCLTSLPLFLSFSRSPSPVSCLVQSVGVQKCIYIYIYDASTPSSPAHWHPTGDTHPPGASDVREMAESVHVRLRRTLSVTAAARQVSPSRSNLICSLTYPHSRSSNEQIIARCCVSAVAQAYVEYVSLRYISRLHRINAVLEVLQNDCFLYCRIFLDIQERTNNVCVY